MKAAYIGRIRVHLISFESLYRVSVRDLDLGCSERARAVFFDLSRGIESVARFGRPR